nr:uncharacterized protein LOC111421548 [Onthophagus taurus]
MDRISRHLNRDECVEAVTLANEGISYREIGLRLGVSHTTISRAVQRFQETNDHTRRPGQGRRRVTTLRQDRFIRLRALRERFVAMRNLQIQVADVHNIRISTNTEQRRLAEGDLHARIPARAPNLNANHRRRRLQFSREHLDWNADDWEQLR